MARGNWLLGVHSTVCHEKNVILNHMQVNKPVRTGGSCIRPIVSGQTCCWWYF